MRFDFEGFFRQNNIEYRTSGKNCKAGHVVINCPLCGNDTGQHMGCNPETGMWGCWRDASHRGKNPAALVKVVMGCSWGEAVKITGGDEIAPGVGTYEDLERQADSLGTKADNRRRRVLKYPPEFRRIMPDGVTSGCWEHLWNKRKFFEPDVRALCDSYLLRYSPFGEWKQRIILPFLHKSRAIIGWQGRAIGKANLRYISYPQEAAGKRLLFNFGPALAGGTVLAITEGPFDCLKMDFYGRRAGIRAVATLGVSFTPEQVGLLFRLAPLYQRLMIFFDPDALAPALSLQDRLARYGAILGQVPDNRDDPGDLEPCEVVPLVKSFL